MHNIITDQLKTHFHARAATYASAHPEQDTTMWPFKNKKSLLQLGVMDGLADHHSHILPGVDDGIRAMADSLAALRRYRQEGVSRLWLTPHIMEDYPNTTPDLRRRFDELLTAYRAEEGDDTMQLHLAAEHMLDTLFARRLSEHDLLTLDGKNTLLVETSYFNPPAGLYRLLEEIMHNGYRIVLAHPERYMYMNSDDYARLHDMGVEMQLNLPSAAGAYGQEAAARAESLLKKNYYGLAGTDIHSLRGTLAFMNRPIKASVANRILELTNQQNTH